MTHDIPEIFSGTVDWVDELSWEGLFSELKERGLHKVNLGISEGHKGIQAALEHVFPVSSWQMCYIHFIRGSPKLPKKLLKEIAQLLKESLTDPRRFQECADELDIRGFHRAADNVERFIPGLLNY